MTLASIVSRALLVAGALSCILLPFAPARAEAADKPEEGFVSLFDGKSLAGWEVMNGGKFTAEEGVIKLSGGGGWLRSQEEFADFELRFDVRWLKPKQDSGIFLRASKEGKGWPDRKYEVQCENSGRLATIFGAKHERDAAHCEKLLKAPGEWQTFEIVCSGANCEVRFNGEPAAKSASLKPGSGYLGIQGENGQLEFRNLRIKKLAAAEAPKEAPKCDTAAEAKKADEKKAEDKEQNDKKKVEDKKPEDKKPDAKKPDDKKPDDKKPDDKKPDDKKPDDKKPDDKKPDTKKPDDKKPDDKKPDDKKPDDKKPEKPKEIEPAVVEPGVTGTPDQPGKAPSDALVLFDGSNFDHWTHGKPDEPVKWKLLADARAMEIGKGGGTLRTKESFGYGQYHFEFRTPAEVKGSGQGRGNSGIYTLGGPEVQVLDSYNNPTYFNGQCGSIYGFYAPLVNASRPPGTWQSYDILYHPPVLDGDGKPLRSATMTVLHNGVLIHSQAEIKGMNDPKRKGKIDLQDHGNPVAYRNIWFRPLVKEGEKEAEKKEDGKKDPEKKEGDKKEEAKGNAKP